MNELATTERNFTADQVTLIKSLVAVGCSDDELALFLYTCKKTGLDPLARQIYAIKRGGKMTIQTGIDGYRVIADRTGRLSGISDYTFDSETEKNPQKATVTVRKIVGHVTEAEFTATARWGEYNAGGPMWSKMPYLMLGKCAEALALRKAFPADLSGVYTAEEMAQADNPERDQVFAEVERQKSNVGQLPNPTKDVLIAAVNISREIPPELEFSYQRSSGVLICRLVDVQKKAKADGKEYVVLTINNELDKGKKPLLYYWHATHREDLLKAKGKIVKLLIVAKEKGFTVDAVMEIDGEKVSDVDKEADTSTQANGSMNGGTSLGTKPFDSAETQARLLASTMDFEEEDIREIHSRCKGSWSTVLEKLKEEKVRRDDEEGYKPDDHGVHVD